MARVELEAIRKQHEELLHQGSETSNVDINISQVQEFLSTLARAGADIEDVEMRSWLRALINYWASFVNDKIGEFPVIQLQPFDITQAGRRVREIGLLSRTAGIIQNASANPSGLPHTLLNIQTFKAIHDTLQLGWSIIELKSRIQVAAMSTSISGPAQTSPTKRAVVSTDDRVAIILQEVLSAVDNAKSQLLLPEAGMLQQPVDSMASRQNLTDLPDNSWLTSLLRATFTRIAESHKRSFPESSTAGTYYDLPDPSNTYLPYLYLYPAGGPDYGDIGIKSDSEITDFKLYDVTRRAVNCLTLLYTNPEESLIPDIVSEFQKHLVQNISDYIQLPIPDVVSQAATSFEDQRNNAIQLVSNQAVRYLETWDCYARETLYVSDGGDAEANEMQLIAYEAGRAMASLSWGITTATVPIEDAMNQAANERGEDGLTEQLHTHPELKKRLEAAWLNVFDERSITSIQRQISALSTALDEAYYRVHPNVTHQDANDVAVQPNLDLPSQAIRTVSESLDYWMRAVQLICSGNAQQQNGTHSNAPSPLTDHAVQSRLTTSQSAIPEMTWETSNQLRLALIQQAEIWQSLLLHQQSLQDFTDSYVTQRIWNDSIQEFEQTTNAGMIKTEGKEFRRYLIPIIAGVVVLLAILGIFALFLIRIPSLQQSLVTAFAVVVGSIVGFFGVAASRMSSFFSTTPTRANATPEGTGPINALDGLTVKELVDTLQNGYQRILTEFDYLNHNVSVTYPLVEFFISYSNQLTTANAHSSSLARNIPNTRKSKTNSNQNTISSATIYNGIMINDAYDFLTQVVWTNKNRADEIGRIARAAFGAVLRK